MKTRSKALLLTLCAVLLVAATIFGTMAYLTSTDTVTNTFTVGKVNIKLDEAKANPDGSLVANADRVKANSYKLLPGHTYNKDPMVTVLGGSESSYVKMTVTFSKANELDAIFAPDGANLTSIFNGYDALDALFDSITVPGEITNEQLATIEGMTITVNAYAIQADGFANADAAWAAFN